MEFVPPYPLRLPDALPAFALLKAARRNLLEIWSEKAFEYEFFQTRLLSRQVFVCNSPDTVQQAFVAQHEIFQRKSAQMRNALQPLLGDGLFISDGETWKQRRRLIAPVIHVSHLDRFAPTMIEVASEMAERLARSSGPVRLDMLGGMASLTAEIICRTIFGRNLGHAHAKEIVDNFTEYQRSIEQMNIMSLFGLPDWLPRLRGGGIAKPIRRIHAVIEEIIRTDDRHGDSEQSMLRLLVKRGESGTHVKLTAEQLRNEAAVLFMAGHETTANSLAWTWYLLSQAPWAEERLHAELDEVLGGRTPTFEDFPRLVYTRAVFEEALRLYPPVPLLSREAGAGGELRRRNVPEGSVVLVVPWLLHRHRKHWDKPDHFIPERFLPENSADRSKFIYVPFSIGQRNCAGAAFGLTEGVLCLATLAQRLRLTLDRPNPVMPVCRLTLRPEGGLPMVAHPRGPKRP
jgi:cytochrome P450